MILSGVIPETVQLASMVSQSIISFTKLSRLSYPFALCLLYYKLSVLRDENSIYSDGKKGVSWSQEERA